jgi:hypothetical protein
MPALDGLLLEGEQVKEIFHALIAWRGVGVLRGEGRCTHATAPALAGEGLYRWSTQVAPFLWEVTGYNTCYQLHFKDARPAPEGFLTGPPVAVRRLRRRARRRVLAPGWVARLHRRPGTAGQRQVIDLSDSGLSFRALPEDAFMVGEALRPGAVLLRP